MRVLVILMLIVINNNSADECSKKNECTESSSNKYSEGSNQLISAIKTATESYRPCEAQNCSCYFDIIARDLHPFAQGITLEMIQSAERHGTKYQVIDHRLYRQKDCMFPARCSGIEHFIKPLLKILPNMEMIINSRDWPQIPRNIDTILPVFSFSKTPDYLDIMYPTWGFWAGGPAISLYPTGLGRWDKHRESLREAAKKWPWDRKLSKGFFRGSRTSDERDSLVLLSRSEPDLVDAQYTKNQAWKSAKDTLNAEPASEVSLEDHCQYKYLFNFRGVAASFRFKHLFLCNSLVFHVGNDWIEFFYDAMKPWVHYVPLKSYPKTVDLKDTLEFFKRHDSLALEIAERGRRFVRKQLRMKDVECYWERLLVEYSKLIRFDVVRDKQFMEIN